MKHRAAGNQALKEERKAELMARTKAAAKKRRFGVTGTLLGAEDAELSDEEYSVYDATKSTGNNKQRCVNMSKPKQSNITLTMIPIVHHHHSTLLCLHCSLDSTQSTPTWQPPLSGWLGHAGLHRAVREQCGDDSVTEGKAGDTASKVCRRGRSEGQGAARGGGA